MGMLLASPLEEARRRIVVFVMAHHLVVRAGLKALLATAGDVDLAGESIEDTDAPARAAACRAEVVIIDPDPHFAEGIVVARRLADAAPSMKSLILTGAAGPETHDMAQKSGARGLVPKDAPLEELITAIRCVHRGELWFRQRVRAPAHEPDVHARHFAALTSRQREIVSLIAEGLRNEQIAARIGVSVKTVRNQLSTVFDRLGVNDRLALAVYAFEHGLLQQPA